MRVLILDDDPYRHAAFDRWYGSQTLVHAYTAQEAKDALARDVFDLVSLDHDLADFGVQRLADGTSVTREYTGYDVAVFLVTEVPKERWPARVIVHSWNVPRARGMVELLLSNGANAIHAPFST